MNREAENRHNHIEILAPAGSYESLTAALAAGAVCALLPAWLAGRMKLS